MFPRTLSLVGFLCVLSAGCHDQPPASLPHTELPPEETITERRHQMSTYVAITVAAPESPEATSAIAAAFAEIDRVELLLSEWKPGSQISEVNRNAGIRPVAVGEELLGVLQTAHEVSVQSDGAFDVTVGALWGAWDFSWQKPDIPGAAELRRRVALIDFRRVILDREKRTVFLKDKGMLVALGGIAKGYAVDRASAVLESKGFGNHLIVAGGDLYAAGRKPSGKWRIGVRHPGRQDMFGTIEVENGGVATSGNYERYFMKGGKRYHHILDPKTGMPASGLASATVVAPNATLADAFATAIFVSGAEGGLALAERLEGIDAFLFAEDTFARRASGDLMLRVKPLEAFQEVTGPLPDVEGQ